MILLHLYPDVGLTPINPSADAPCAANYLHFSRHAFPLPLPPHDLIFNLIIRIPQLIHRKQILGRRIPLSSLPHQPQLYRRQAKLLSYESQHSVGSKPLWHLDREARRCCTGRLSRCGAVEVEVQFYQARRERIWVDRLRRRPLDGRLAILGAELCVASMS